MLALLWGSSSARHRIEDDEQVGFVFSLVGRIAKELSIAHLAWCAFLIFEVVCALWSVTPATLQAALNNLVVVLRVQDGEVLLDGANAHRTLGLDEMPPDMPLLLTAMQDPRFFDHGGVDVLGIARAVLANVTHLGLNEGASTLTMRLAKTSLTGASPTLARKII